MSASLSEFTLEETRAALLRRDVSPTEVAAGYLAAIGRWEPAGAFVTVSEERLRADARRAENDLLGGTAGPLTGIGVSVKDNIDVAGLPTTAGSAWFSERVVADAESWRRLAVAGAVHVGKTNMHEFAYGASNVNHKARAALNPWDLRRASGGSSGGSAVSVAIGACGASLGTDTGGSVRIPAALTGVTGFKPSQGLVPTAKVFPLSPSCDTVGVFSRTAAGCAHVMRSLLAESAGGGGDIRRDSSLRGLRLGLVRAHLAAASPAVREVITSALGVLEGLGAAVDWVDLRHEEEARAVTSTVVAFEAAQVHRRWLRDRPGDYEDDVRARLEKGLAVPASHYRAAKRERRRLTAELLAGQASFDAVIGPTVPVTAPKVTDCGTERAPAVQAVLLANTYCFNVTGQPAISIPGGTASDGLPAGLQIAAGPGKDRDVLAIAMAVQDATDWHDRRPPPKEPVP
ncbi:amidase [Actinomadura mexicana]|uniref:Aspartyl-tRNA(Asn)/glutamyl-tRNA(Gln) amidotransferase subunit A n=1 Tax=Actinomadura mexicana TaxID=134959 RepID=A0A238XEB2_9ACTN|nr:amidase [Actinomadura mexicana]SNR56259.1 aspartyl-tRNA(Asn)/glutamyl-tRNA(Gln) amidotransferase subunit A [Actinomadura mexicana]